MKKKLQIDGETLLFDLYHYLKCKNTTTNEYLNLRIPDTVYFRLGEPFEWYFTEEYSHSIKKKLKDNINMENIEREFLKVVP